MQHGNSSFFPQNRFPPRCQMTFLLRARATVTYMYMLSSCGSNGKCNLNYNSPESYTVGRGASEQSHKTLPRVYRIDSMNLGHYIFLVTSRNINCVDAQPDISQRDKVHLSETLVVF